MDRKIDPKHDHVLAIYTQTDVFAAICQDEIDLQEWIDKMQTVLQSVHKQTPRRNFSKLIKLACKYIRN